MSKINYTDYLKECVKEGDTFVQKPVQGIDHHPNHDEITPEVELERYKRQILHGLQKVEKYRFWPHDEITSMSNLMDAVKDAPDEYAIQDLLSKHTEKERDELQVETVDLDEGCDKHGKMECGECDVDVISGVGGKERHDGRQVFQDDVDEYDEDGKVKNKGKDAVDKLEEGEGTNETGYDKGDGKVVKQDEIDKLLESELQDKYKAFFKDKLASFKAKSPAELTDAQKVEFFNQIKKDWKAEKKAKGLKTKAEMVKG